MKLNLGCGDQHQQGFINIDKQPPADLVRDVTLGLPFSDGAIEYVRANGLLEHFDNNEYLFVMNECHRILQPNGVFWFKVPNAIKWPDGAFGDPTHCRFFTPRSFEYLMPDLGHSDRDLWHYGKAYGFKPWRGKVVAEDGFFIAEFIPIK